MGTYLDLKTRVASEANAGLSASDTAVANAILTAIENYETRAFWFNESSDTFTTVAGTSTYSTFTGGTVFAGIVRTTIAYSGTSVSPLAPWTWGAVIDADSDPTALRGIPYAWARQGTSYRLYPVPIDARVVTFYGTAVPAVLSADTGSNVWTNEGSNLIRNAALAELCLSYLNDPERGSVFASREQQQLNILTGRNTRMLATGRIRKVAM